MIIVEYISKLLKKIQRIQIIVHESVVVQNDFDFVSYKFFVNTLPASSIIQLVSGLGWDSAGTL